MNAKEEESFHRSMDEWEESSDNFYAHSNFAYTMGTAVKKLGHQEIASREVSHKELYRRREASHLALDRLTTSMQ